jgi:hypothetical protein
MLPASIRCGHGGPEIAPLHEAAGGVRAGATSRENPAQFPVALFAGCVLCRLRRTAIGTKKSGTREKVASSASNAEMPIAISSIFQA